MAKTQVHDPQLKEGIMRRGFPRPVFDMQRYEWKALEGYPRFLPTPYTAETHAIANLSDERARECLVDMVCSVCGDKVEFNEQGWITVLFKNSGLIYESGPFHDKCGVLTMKMCPHIARSDEWSIGMVNADTWARNKEHWGETYPFTDNPFDCKSQDMSNESL
jgi:hypothetical protein